MKYEYEYGKLDFMKFAAEREAERSAKREALLSKRVIIKNPTGVQTADALMSLERESAFVLKKKLLIRGTRTAVKIYPDLDLGPAGDSLIHNHPGKYGVLKPSKGDLILAYRCKLKDISIVFPQHETVLGTIVIWDNEYRFPIEILYHEFHTTEYPLTEAFYES